MTSKENFVFRRARIDDIAAVREMVQEFAAFNDVHGVPELSTEDFIQDAGLNGGTEYFDLYLIEFKSEDEKNPTPIGYAMCNISWSSSIGKNYCLRNFYIKPEYRKLGAGTRSLCEIAAIVKENGYKYLSFYVASWNTAAEFYKNLGATLKDSQLFELNEDQIKELSEQLQY